MAQIKFVRGVKANYEYNGTHEDAIFFATDTHELLVNNEVYGLGRAVSDIAYNETDHELNITFVGNVNAEGPDNPQSIDIVIPLAGDKAGLMSAEDKAALEELIGSGEGSVQDQINAVKEVIDTYTVNGLKISTNPVLNGANILLDGYKQTGGDTTAVAATDTVNQAIAKVENANTNTQNALEEFKGTVNQPNGIAGLDENGKIDPSLVDGVVGHVLGLEQFVENASLPAASVDNVGKYYFVTDENKIAECVENEGVYSWEKTDPQPQVLYNRRGADEQGHTNTLYRWDGSAMVAVSDPITIGELTGTAYDGAEGKANRDALDSAPNTVVTGFGLVTPAAGSVSVAFTDSDKNGENNQYAAADGGNIVIPAATATTAGVMTAADKTYIEEVKTALGNNASALKNVLKVDNAGIGLLANYKVAAAAADIAPTDTINVALGKLEKALKDLTGEGGEGSIQKQIQSAINAIKGDASGNGDTLGKLEDQIEANDIQSIAYDQADRIITVTKGDDSTVATALPLASNSVAGLMSTTDKAALDKAVTDITANKVVAADTSIVVGTNNTNTTLKVNVKAGDNALKLDGGGLFVDQAALTSYEGLNAITIADKAESEGVKEVALKINANDKVLSQSADGLLATFAIAKLGTATEGYAASYQLQDKSGNAMGVTIDIPKDMVVSAGEVKTVETTDQPYSGAVIGDKYIDLTIANATSSHIWIPVKDLVDVYTAGNGINVSGSNVISAVVDQASESFLTLETTGIKLSGVQTAINAAKSTIDAYKVNNKAISTNPVLNGADIALTGYVPVDGGTVAATDSVNAAINKLETSLVWYDA